MSGYSHYVVAYDISCDQERSRVEKILLGIGFRVQKSVFEVRLNRGGHERLIGMLEGLHLKTGFIKIYTLAPQAHHRVVGEAPPSLDEAFAFVV